MFLLNILFSWSAIASYDVNFPRGLEGVLFQSPLGVSEQCVVTRRLPGVDLDSEFNKKKWAKEAELCRIDFYSSSIGICPKTNSTNPGIDIYQGEGECSASEVERPKVAKYKQSVSCSYAPSILSYYQFSLLFRSLNVPPAVIRTMDKSKHASLRSQALNLLAGQSSKTIYKTWSGSWGQAYNNPKGHRGERVFTSDQKQVYGALSVNPKNEFRYKEIYGSYKSYDERFKSLSRQRPFLNLTTAKPLRDMFGGQARPDVVQNVIQVRDMADMMLFDFILGQQDRPGNIHYQEVFYSSLDGTDWTKKNNPQAQFNFSVKEMILKDNDCGIIKGNAVKELGWLNDLSHMSQRTYTKLQNLSKFWLSNLEEMKAYAKADLLFTDADFTTVTSDLKIAAETLKKRCLDGALFLDADLDYHFSASPEQQRCD